MRDLRLEGTCWVGMKLPLLCVVDLIVVKSIEDGGGRESLLFKRDLTQLLRLPRESWLILELCEDLVLLLLPQLIDVALVLTLVLLSLIVDRVFPDCELHAASAVAVAVDAGVVD